MSGTPRGYSLIMRSSSGSPIYGSDYHDAAEASPNDYGTTVGCHWYARNALILTSCSCINYCLGRSDFVEPSVPPSCNALCEPRVV